MTFYIVQIGKCNANITVDMSISVNVKSKLNIINLVNRPGFN